MQASGYPELLKYERSARLKHKPLHSRTDSTALTDELTLPATGSQLGWLRRIHRWVEKHAARSVWCSLELNALNKLGMQPNHTVLSLGCTGGELMIRRVIPRSCCKIMHCVDPSRFALDQTMRRNRRAAHYESIKFHRATFESLPIANSSIDRVITANSLHGWRDPALVIAELTRVMKPSSVLCIYAKSPARHHRSPGRVSIHSPFGESDLASMFKARADSQWDYAVPSNRSGILLLASPSGASTRVT